MSKTAEQLKEELVKAQSDASQSHGDLRKKHADRVVELEKAIAEAEAKTKSRAV